MHQLDRGLLLSEFSQLFNTCGENIWNSCMHALDEEFRIFGKNMELALSLTCMLCEDSGMAL